MSRRARAYRGLTPLTLCCLVAATGLMWPASRHVHGAHHAAAPHHMAGMSGAEGTDPPSADPSSPLPRARWTATASHRAPTDAPAGDQIGDSPATVRRSHNPEGARSVRHVLTIDTHAHNSVSGLTYVPERRASAGTIGRFSVSVSNDGRHWGVPVSTGTFLDDAHAKTTVFRPVRARFVRLTALGDGDAATGAASPSVAGVRLLGTAAAAGRP